MKIPKQLKVGGHIYNILYPYEFKERTDIYGQTRQSDLTIKIGNLDSRGIHVAESVLIATFIHEVLHAIDFNTGLNIFSSEDGETRIEALSEGIFQVLIDNKYIELAK